MKQETLYSFKSECCGCEACVNICPKNIISMIRDEEGFYYPQILENDSCINCQACLKVCPIKHSSEIESTFKIAYAGHANNKETTINSASGGFATVLAEEFLKHTHGIVYGVSYDRDFMSVSYCGVSSIEELPRFQTSKYSQANKHDLYVRIKKDLKDKNVLFIGTPCDAFALTRFVGEHDNLFIATLICHGPTSEKIHETFFHSLEKQFDSRITDLSLRYKKDGNWKPYYIRAKFSNGKEYLHRFDDTVYNTAFLYFKRPSCSKCHFKKNRFAGDVLIGDYHSANPGTEAYYVHGVSSILPLTEKGRSMLAYVNDEFQLMEVSVQSSIGQQAVHSPVIKPTNRTDFIERLDSVGLEAACKIPSIRLDQIKTKVKRTVRSFLGKQKRMAIKLINLSQKMKGRPPT